MHSLSLLSLSDIQITKKNVTDVRAFPVLLVYGYEYGGATFLTIVGI